jgi:hypothetical protein
MITHNDDSTQVGARSVSWRQVHRFIGPVLDAVKDWPTVGTPAWCSLAHEDPRKWAALLDAAQHHALRLELNQQTLADASKEIAAAADWAAVSRELTQLQDFRKSHTWSKRVAS